MKYTWLSVISSPPIQSIVLRGFFSATGLCLICFPVLAQEPAKGVYVRVDTGYSVSRDLQSENIRDDVDESAIIGGGIGYRFTPHFRSDLTVSHRSGYEVDISNRDAIPGSVLRSQADASSTVGMLNVYGEVGTFGIFTPYIGGGIGVSRNKFENTRASLDGTRFVQIDDNDVWRLAWQASLGTAIALNARTALDIGYRYVDFGKIETGDSGFILGAPATNLQSSGSLRAHEIQVGMRFQF